MPINSPGELRRVLERLDVLDERELRSIMESAHYNANRQLDGIYSAPLENIDPAKKVDFLRAAGAYVPALGGDIKGNEVRPDAYPTGNPMNPCSSRDNFWCWSE